MSVLEFSLFFVAILVGYVLVHLRLVRFEEHMRKLAGIRSMDDRLRVVDDRLRVMVELLEKARLDRIEGHIERLHEGLEDLREATGDVRQAVVEIPQPTVQLAAAPDEPRPAAAAPEPYGARVQGLIEARLLQMGYGGIQMLSELGAARADRDTEVQVECERGGMPTKGRVVVRNGAVRDVALQTVAQMFP